MIRVLVVDDSVTVRKQVGRILAQSPGMTVAGEAADGLQAVDANCKLRPDVILMDLEMPVMSGPEAVERIMATCACPIVVLSAFVRRGEKFKTWDAMLAGAVATIEKSDVETNPQRWEKELIRTVRAAARIKVRRRRGTLPGKGGDKSRQGRPPDTAGPYNVVAIGGSTGSISVIAKIVCAFPADFRLPILLVVHLADTRDDSFAQWLAGQCRLPVASARGGEKLTGERARVLIAPPQRHMVVANGAIGLDGSKPVNYCRPSVDALFSSLARDKQMTPIGVLLTGIGRDGARGLKAIRNSGGYTICQDKTTSIVFGMPGAAIQMGGACKVLPDDEIAAGIMEVIGDRDEQPLKVCAGRFNAKHDIANRSK
ncbi:MAG: chemotaxis-specific protein-glutamate methyltransferase CheB [Desulfobacteraceae bacterium]|jgi:two-component system chemotaxis response regulator CheB